MSVRNINAEEYRSYIQSETPVLVEFWAPWCVYCRRLAPVLEAASGRYEGTLPFAVVNVDLEPELEDAEGIELIPTVRIYQKGRLLGSVVAPESGDKLEAFIREALEQAEKKQDSEKEHVYDMLIIGGGPGGYTAALYAARAGLDTLVLEKLSAGGQMALTDRIDNYPGFDEGVDGFTLGEKMQKGAERFGAKSLMAEVQRLELSGPIKKAFTASGEFSARTVVIATGAGPRRLGLEREEELLGRGVNYCAACDGMFYKDKTVFVIGGGNSAAADALILSRICKKVIIVHRRDSLRATKIYHQPLMQAENVEFRWNSEAVELLGEERVRGLKLKNVKSGEETQEECDGVFISVGRKPATELVEGLLELDSQGYIPADESTRSSLPGVFAVGDVRAKGLRQIVTAVADGAVAVHYAEEYLAEMS